MATLVPPGGGARVPLASDTVLGRSSRCHIVLNDSRVSGHHAALRWTGEAWEVRDLGSRNGTWVSGSPLPSGQGRLLEAGDTLAFGRETAHWTVADVSAPVAMAVSASGDWVFADDDLLLLPDAESAEVCIYATDGGWSAEHPDRVDKVEDDDEITVLDETYTLLLPSSFVGTRAAGPSPIDLRSARLELRVSQDEEHVEMRLLNEEDDRLDLPHRAHLYLLLTLARARLDDRTEGDITTSEEGWRYQDDLERQLRIKPNQFNVVLFRARAQLRKAGVVHADALIERRRGSGQLRIGVEKLVVGPL